MSIAIKRAYEAPAATDGYRVLVDRLWPRGRSRDALQLDEWARELAPSTALRRWFGHDVSRWEGFRARYLDELRSDAASGTLERLGAIAASGTLTLVYAARDTVHNEARVLAEVLDDGSDAAGRHSVHHAQDRPHRPGQAPA